YQPCWQPTESQTSTQLLVAEIAAVIWCTGYRSDFSWVEVPVFDGSGLPVHQRGVTPVPGLYFIGLPWLHTWGSGRFCGVGQDAEYLADQIQWRRDRRDASQERLECTALLGS
ncbi:FAD-dependent oxidoreductase, partial [Clostridium botulinum]